MDNHSKWKVTTFDRTLTHYYPLGLVDSVYHPSLVMLLFVTSSVCAIRLLSGLYRDDSCRKKLCYIARAPLTGGTRCQDVNTTDDVHSIQLGSFEVQLPLLVPLPLSQVLLASLSLLQLQIPRPWVLLDVCRLMYSPLAFSSSSSCSGNIDTATFSRIIFNL